MSDEIRTEQQRLVAELASLVEGLNDEVSRLDKQLTNRDKKLREIKNTLARVVVRLQAIVDD